MADTTTSSTTQQTNPSVPTQPQTGIFSGTVTTGEQNSQPLANIRVEIYDKDALLPFTALTGPDGRFVIPKPLPLKPYTVKYIDPQGKYYNLPEFQAQPGELSPMSMGLRESAPPKIKQESDLGHKDLRPRNERMNQYIKSIVDQVPVETNKDFEGPTKNLNIETLAKKYDLPFQQKQELQFIISSSQENLDITKFSKEIQDKIKAVNQNNHSTSQSRRLAIKLGLDYKETEEARKRLLKITQEKEALKALLEEKLAKGKISLSDYQAQAKVVDKQFIFNPQTLSRETQNKILDKLYSENKEFQQKIEAVVEEELKDERQKEREALALQASEQLEKVQAANTVVQAAIAEDIGKQLLQEEKVQQASQQTPTQPGRSHLSQTPIGRDSINYLNEALPQAQHATMRAAGTISRGVGKFITQTVIKGGFSLMAPLWPYILGAALIIGFIVFIVVLFFRKEQVPFNDIANCTFFATSAGQQNGLKVGDRKLSNLVVSIANQVGIHPALVMAILRYESPDVFKNDNLALYLQNDFDPNPSNPDGYFGVMQLSSGQFENIWQYNSSFIQSIYPNKKDITTTIPSSPPTLPLAEDNYIKLYSVKESILMAAVKLKQSKDEINGGEPYDEKTVKQIAQQYHLQCEKEKGLDGNFCNDVWRGFTSCQDLQSGDTPDNPIQGLTLNKSGPTQVANGDTIEYQVSVTYTQDLDVIINDPIPANTTLVTASGPYTQEGNIIKWRLKDFAASVSPEAPQTKTYKFELKVKPDKNDINVTNSSFGIVYGNIGTGIGDSSDFETLMANQGRNVTVIGDEDAFVNRVLLNKGAINLDEQHLRQVYRTAAAKNVNPLSVLAIWGVEASFGLNGTEFGCKPFGSGFADQLTCGVNTLNFWMSDFDQNNRGGSITLTGVKTCVFTDPFTYAYEKYTPVCTINDNNDNARRNFVTYYKKLGK